MSCAGNGYLTGNMDVAFPFKDGDVLAWGAQDSLSAQLLLQRCFVDAGMFIYDSGYSVQGGYPSIGMFSVNGDVLYFQVSAGGSSMQLYASPSQEAFPVLYGSAPWGWYTLVMSSEGMRDFMASGFPPPAPGYSSPSGQGGGLWLRLCARCVHLSAGGLLSIKVYDGVKPKAFDTYEKGYIKGDTCYRNGSFHVCVRTVPKGGAWNDSDWEDVDLLDVSRRNPSFTVRGNVRIRPGNNMLLSEPDSENGIKLEAVPGAGLGTVPCQCQSASDGKSPLSSPDGHVRFFNDTCYDLEPRICSVDDGNGGEKRVGIISVHAKCTACCTCDMYASIVNDRLVPISDSIRASRTSLSEMLDKYENAITRFNRRLAVPEMSDISMSLSGMPVGNNLGSRIDSAFVKGRMGRCAFTAIIRNSSFSMVTATIYSMSGSDTVAEASASWSDEDGSSRSRTSDSAYGMTGQSFDIWPGRSLAVTFVSVKNDMIGSAGAGKYTGSLSVGFSYKNSSGGSISLGTLERSVEV